MACGEGEAAPICEGTDSPGLARAAASGLETVKLTTDSGRSVSAAAQQPTATIMLVHECWGLSDQIKVVAAELAREGYMELAIDLYSGRVATDRDTARRLVGSVESDAATDTVASWWRWLKAHSDGNKRLGTVGWCFGGGWALNAALAESADATVMYYGNVQKTKSQLESSSGRSPAIPRSATSGSTKIWSMPSRTKWRPPKTR